MKYIKILLLSAMLFSANVFALSSPSQIGAMMDSGNLRGAESALKDVLRSGKDTAKVHYMLAQVYQKEGRLSDARSELGRANQMDPEHSYTDNAHYRPIADVINGRVNNTNAAVGAPAAVMAVASTPTDYSFLGYFLLFAVVVSAGIVVFMFFRNKREEQEQFDSSNSQLRSGAALLVQDIQKAILSEKTSVAPVAAKLTAINAVNFRALNVYDRVKGLVTTEISDIVRLSDEVADIRQALNEVLDADYSGTSPTVKVTKSRRPVVAAPIEAEEAAIPARVTQTIPAAAPVITQSQPQVVVVGGSNNGMSMTDLLVADMIINEPHRHRDDEYFSRPAAPGPEFQESYAPAVEPDTGNNDRWTSPNSDTGNDDSFSSSNSDSGNDDRWSSSSDDSSSSSSSDWDSSSSSDSGSSDSF